MGASGLTTPSLPPASSLRLRTFSSCAAHGAGPQLSVVRRHSVRRCPRPIRASSVDAVLGNRIARAGVWPNGTDSRSLDSSAWTPSTVEPSPSRKTCSPRTTVHPRPQPACRLSRVSWHARPRQNAVRRLSLHARPEPRAVLRVVHRRHRRHGGQPSSVSVGPRRTVKTARLSGPTIRHSRSCT